MSVTLQRDVKMIHSLKLDFQFLKLLFNCVLRGFTRFSITYVVAYRGKIDPTIRALVNPDSECLGEGCCSSVRDETF